MPARTSPSGTIDTRFSSAGAQPVPWTDAVQVLEQAETFWLSTVRSDGRPHVTPLIAIWMDDAIHFCTGADEQKAKNLATTRGCALTTGNNSLGEGLDVIVEGEAVRVTDTSVLDRLRQAYGSKYGWQFTVRDDVLVNEEGGEALVFAVTPVKAFGFAKGETFSQTRWRW